MSNVRKLSLTLVVACGLAWSLLLALGGAWLLGAGPAAWGAGTAPATTAAGVSAVAGGLLVFLACVADRVFPGVSKAVVLCTEVPLCAVLFGGLGVLAWAAV